MSEFTEATLRRVRNAALPFGAAVSLLTLGGCIETIPTQVNVKPYAVSGTDNASIDRSLALHGPLVEAGQPRAFAAVETTFLHSYVARQMGGACRFGTGQVGLRSEVTLPRWRDHDDAPAALQDKWDLLSRYAVLHENGHIHISQRYAHRLNGLYRRAEAPDCDALEVQVEHGLPPISAAHVRDQTKFDRTDPKRFNRYLRQHGYTSGG